MEWFAAVIAAVLGLAFLALARGQFEGKRTWPTTEATVVSHETTGDLWFAVVAFTTADGHGVRAENSVGYSLRRPRLGRQVQVRYDPADPRRIVVGSSWLPGLLFTAIGLASLASAGAIVVHFAKA